MTGAPRIDAHQHFLDIESGRYSWPTPSEGRIYRTFTPMDLEPDLALAGVDATVLVQTVDTLDDSDSMLAAVDRHRFIKAIVGWIPPTGARSADDARDARPDRRLGGIRHLLHRDSDPNGLLRAGVAEGLDVVARRGLAFDVLAVFPNHLRLVPSVADRYPDVTFVVDALPLGTGRTCCGL